MTDTETRSRSKSADLRTGRYLPDGTLNIAGRWKSPGIVGYLIRSKNLKLHKKL